MKKILASLLLLVIAVPAFAQHRHHDHRGPVIVHKSPGHHFRHHRHWHPHYGWVVPAVVGGAVVYSMTRPVERVIVQQDPDVTAETVVCSEWKEIQTSDGKIYRERTCREQ